MDNADVLITQTRRTDAELLHGIARYAPQYNSALYAREGLGRASRPDPLWFFAIGLVLAAFFPWPRPWLAAGLALLERN